ncbi:LysR family transcriptional regulator [Tepidibacter mesophilus]|uniref:LysR family transcriptional regulator n=1 Tax=Tepidibacter mesophilus TaxID=655607 RepID=UPI000C08B9EE|nr:LysR family transcriptional regulator [Tepidibacter mesophilus]
MNLQQLQYFRKLAETKNFTAAADSVSVTQPALSKAISNLEAELNVPLFERNGRNNIEITSFGKVFLKHTNLALIEIEKGINELKNMLNPDEAIISIASTHCIGTYFMPFIISDFLNCYPDTKFQFNHESTQEILRDLKHGKINLGFYDSIADIHNHPEIESIPVKKEEYVLIVPKNHHLSSETEVSLKDLKDESFIVFYEGNKDKKLSYSEFINYAPKISIHPNEASMLGGLVTAGAGIAIVPNTPFINTNTLSIVKISDNIGYKTIYMGWAKDSYMSVSTKKFRDYAKSLNKI